MDLYGSYTATSSNVAVATTSIDEFVNKITITSVGEETAIITVNDGTVGHNETIVVTVAAKGGITIGTITPYVS